MNPALYPGLQQTRLDELRRGEGGPAPFGGDECRAHDNSGQEWTITIAAPSSGDPRTLPKPEAVVVATRAPHLAVGELRTPVYVLAEYVRAAEVAEVITSVKSPRTLTGLAARLLTLTTTTEALR